MTFSSVKDAILGLVDDGAFYVQTYPKTALLLIAVLLVTLVIG